MKQQIKEGMRYPSVDQLTHKTSSKYKLVIAVAKRAKEIDETELTYIENPVKKRSIGIALEEIYHDLIKIK